MTEQKIVVSRETDDTFNVVEVTRIIISNHSSLLDARAAAARYETAGKRRVRVP